MLDSLSYAALEQCGCLVEHTEGTVVNLTVAAGSHCSECRRTYETCVRFTLFSKMRAVESATAWSSSSTQRTQRNCREEIKNGAREEGLM